MLPEQDPLTTRSLPLSRRALIGVCLAAGAVPLIRPGMALAGPGLASPTDKPTPAGGPPPVVDPAYEMAPPDSPRTIMQQQAPLGRADGRRLKPTTESAPGSATTFSATATVPFQFKYDNFDIRELPVGISPYHMSIPDPLVDTGTHDSTGVRMVLLGTTLYNHPVAQAQYGIRLLESYRITGDTTYLDRAKLQAQRLVDRRVLRDGAWFYPYPFRYALHRLYDIYDPPWYSMMAQGQALSLFVRMFKVTGEAAWKTAADATFASFLLPAVAGKPWGVYVVDGHLWLEEYPNPKVIKGDRTFNGHTFSAYGLYDYYLLTGDANAKLLLQGAITTYRDSADLIRIRHWRSRYCVTHGLDAGNYHSTHINQWIQWFAITGDTWLAKVGDLWDTDYPLQGVKGSVHFGPGTHYGYKFNNVGTILARKTITLSRASSAPSVDRGKVMNHTGIWYSISAGSLAGYQVGEYRGVRYQVGTYALLGYKLFRNGTITQDTPVAYSIDSAGRMSGVRTVYHIGDPVTVDARAVLNGVEHIRLAEGDYAGKWLAFGAVLRD
jgi:hypothetical protein